MDNNSNSGSEDGREFTDQLLDELLCLAQLPAETKIRAHNHLLEGVLYPGQKVLFVNSEQEYEYLFNSCEQNAIMSYVLDSKSLPKNWKTQTPSTNQLYMKCEAFVERDDNSRVSILTKLDEPKPNVNNTLLVLYDPNVTVPKSERQIYSREASFHLSENVLESIFEICKNGEDKSFDNSEKKIFGLLVDFAQPHIRNCVSNLNERFESDECNFNLTMMSGIQFMLDNFSTFPSSSSKELKESFKQLQYSTELKSFHRQIQRCMANPIFTAESISFSYPASEFERPDGVPRSHDWWCEAGVAVNVDLKTEFKGSTCQENKAKLEDTCVDSRTSETQRKIKSDTAQNEPQPKSAKVKTETNVDTGDTFPKVGNKEQEKRLEGLEKRFAQLEHTMFVKELNERDTKARELFLQHLHIDAMAIQREEPDELTNNFERGDRVKVIKDPAELKKLQPSYGEWDEAMAQYCGKNATVIEKTFRRIVALHDDGQRFSYNPRALKKTKEKVQRTSTPSEGASSKLNMDMETILRDMMEKMSMEEKTTLKQMYFGDKDVKPFPGANYPKATSHSKAEKSSK